MPEGEYGYLTIARRILEDGRLREGRNGGTLSTFDANLEFYMSDGFPLLTTKKLHFRSIVAELLWFLSGSTNKFDLQKMGCTIWDEWGDDKTGELGPIYGQQWRNWLGYPDVSMAPAADPESYEKSYGGYFPIEVSRPTDQIRKLIHDLKNDPYSRRHIVSAWNVAQISEMALPPCHVMFQCYVSDGKLSLKMYQRSADWFLGVPFNTASYALLLHLLARECDLEPYKLTITFGDVHIYMNHVEQMWQQVSRNVRKFPKLHIDVKSSIFDLKPEEILVGPYNPHPAIKGEVSK